MPSQRPVILKLEGGLGNQLFQFAAGYYLAAELNTDLIVDQYSIPLSTHHGERRLGFEEFEWPRLPEGRSIKVLRWIPGSIMTRAAVKNVSLKRLLLKVRMYSSNLHFLPTFHETRNTFDFLSLSGPMKLHGNFQSWEIVKAAATHGFPQRLELEYPSDWIAQQLGQNDMSNSIAVHFRVGADALGNASFSQPSKEYYREALVRLGASSKMSNVFVFSDDINLANEKFGDILGKEVHFVNQPAFATPAEKLFHLSKFENIICANSTFCGWAGWTIGNSGGKVVVPVPYSDSQALGSRDFPAEWIKLSKVTGELVSQ